MPVQKKKKYTRALPLTVKSMNHRDNTVSVSSALTRQTETITIERLQFLLVTKKVKLLNAKIVDGQVILFEEFKTPKLLKEYVSKLLYGPINSMDALTKDQREMAEILSNTPFELDIEQTSVYTDYISSKSISFGTYRIHIDAYLLKKSQPQIFSIRADFAHDTASYSTDTVFLTFYATEEDVTEKLNTLVALFKRVAENNISLGYDVCAVMTGCISDKTDHVLEYDGVHMRHICDILDVTDQYTKLLQSRIDESEKHADGIAHFTEFINNKFKLARPDLQTMILYIAFDPLHRPGDFNNMDTSPLDVNGPPIAIERIEKSLSDWYDKAKHFAETQTFTKAFNLSLCQKKGK